MQATQLRSAAAVLALVSRNPPRGERRRCLHRAARGHPTPTQHVRQEACIMCNVPQHRHSIQCILPPYIVRAIAKNGSPQQRDSALDTLASDMTFRTLRASLQLLDPRPARRVNALMGEPNKRRSIYTANHSEDLPGELVRSEGQAATKDVAVNEAYDGLGATYDFYWDVFERNSIDDEGLPLDATVHYGQNYDNAFWNGERMVFGDGDGDLFNRFTLAVDVIGHELTHGVTEDEAKLT